MNNRLYNLISSIASLAMIIVLLVFVTLAWYTRNVQVSSDGVQGIISEGNISNVKLTRYIAEETTDETNNKMYTKKEINQDGVNPYDSLLGYTKLIYEITFTTSLQDLASLKLSIRNISTLRKDGFEAKTIDGKVYHYNYLSNVAIFKELVLTDSVYSIRNPENSAAIPYSNQNDDQIHEISFNQVSPIKSGNNVTIALIFDFNTDHVNQLYTANLGVTSNVRFEDDIEFIVKI